MTHYQKSIKTDTEITDMIKLEDMDVKTIINTLEMLEKREENINIMRREIKYIFNDTSEISKDVKYSI